MPTGHYIRKPGRTAKKKPLLQRFWKFVSPEPNSGCWLWTGAYDNAGYGVISKDLNPVRAHRVSYELFVGPIPEGMVIDHLCRVTCCVNPKHLEPVKTAINCIRGKRGILTTNCPRGHPYDDKNTYTRKTKWGGVARMCKECGKLRNRIKYKSTH